MKPFLLGIILLVAPFMYASAQDASKHIEDGKALIQKESYEEALEQFNMALILDPSSVDALLQRAFTSNILKSYDSAISDYTAVIELNPALISAYLSRGSAYNKLDRFEEALQDFNKVIELDPKNSEAYNNRGWSKKGLGDHDGACDDWKKSKKMGNEEAKIILKNNQC